LQHKPVILISDTRKHQNYLTLLKYITKSENS
jgi:hypothetical protein